MEVVQVQPRDSYLHNIYVPTQAVIKWSFTTKKNNISFGVFRRKEKEPLPNSSDILFRAQLQKRQLSFTNDYKKLNESQEFLEEELDHQSNPRPRSKSIASVKLKESGLEEIIPIQNYNSSTQKIEGCYSVKEPGNYVLVFDNTFSRTTPKVLTYTVALGPEEQQVQAPEITGWLLKKKRKRMQGWAKRWFRLSPTGVLSYSTSQQSVIRGSIQILVSTITYGTQQIHIDSGTMIYHLKTLSEEDYRIWHDALSEIRKKTTTNPDLPPEPVRRLSILRSKRPVEIDRQLESHQYQLGLLSDTIHRLKDVLISNDLRAIQEVMESLESCHRQVMASADTLVAHWHTSGRSLTDEKDAILEELEIPPHRSASVYSRLSAYSDQFFDAEDLVLNVEEEDDQSLFIDNEESSDEESESSSPVLDLSLMTDCVRRTALPSVAVADVGSALGIIRKNVGKDLSTIAMPISMNEPLNMLQKACEELDYSDLLDQASRLSDPLDRLMYVTVFAISSYASSQYRTGRKPFNPMMNETYECLRPDRGFRFISEKVSHNPLIVAAHAESKTFRYWQSTQIKSKFWGKSMEFMTEGTFHLTLTGHADHFTYSKPSSWMKNMIAGEKYLEHSGETKVMNQTTGDYAIVVFKEGTGGGLFGAPTKRNEVIATFYNSRGQKVKRVVGKWSESLAEEIGLDKSKLSVLWTAKPPGIPNHDKYFGFTKFAIELNEMTELEEGKLPITDTRFRPDQLLYEKGLVDEADQEKLRIEQKQRERRKEFELIGKEWNPRWFVREGDEWVYNGQYWPTRESGQWPKDQFELW